MEGRREASTRRNRDAIGEESTRAGRGLGAPPVAGRELVVTTSFGMEGCALIDMVARARRPVPVVYLDTMFLFPETYACATGWRPLPAPRVREPRHGAHARGAGEQFGPELWRRDPDPLLQPPQGGADPAGAEGSGCLDHRPHPEPGRRPRGAPRGRVGLAIPAAQGESRWPPGIGPGSGSTCGATTCPITSCTSAATPRIGCTHCTAPVPGAARRI